MFHITWNNAFIEQHNGVKMNYTKFKKIIHEYNPDYGMTKAEAGYIAQHLLRIALGNLDGHTIDNCLTDLRNTDGSANREWFINGMDFDEEYQ